METLMTVLKRFVPNYKLKKTVNRRKSASRKQDWKDFFQGQIVSVLIQNNSPRGPVNLEHLTFLLFCYIIWY